MRLQTVRKAGTGQPGDRQLLNKGPLDNFSQKKQGKESGNKMTFATMRFLHSKPVCKLAGGGLSPLHYNLTAPRSPN